MRIPIVVTRTQADAGTEALAKTEGFVIDASIAGAGLETDVALEPGERIRLAFATPTMWDPLEVDADVTWSRSDLTKGLRRTVRSGIRFSFAGGPDVLAVFEMLEAVDV